MASLTPAERAGVAHQIGSLEVGKRADLIVLNRRLEVKHVFLGGKRFMFNPRSGERAGNSSIDLYWALKLAASIQRSRSPLIAPIG